MTVIWELALFILVATDQCFRGAYFRHHQAGYGDEGNKFLSNIGHCLSKKIMLHSR